MPKPRADIEYNTAQPETLEGTLNLQFPFEAEKLTRLDGRLVLRLPNTITTTQTSGFDLGQVFSADRVRLKVTEIGQGTVSLAVDGDPNGIVGVALYDADNNIISDPLVRIENVDGKWQINVRMSGIPAYAQIKIAEKMETMDFPFVLAPAGPPD